MKLAVWVAKANTQKNIVTIIIILVISGLLAWHFWPHKVTSSKIGIEQQISQGSLKAAGQDLAQKNYTVAEGDYITAAGAADSPQAAIAILQEAINKIPDKYTDWKLYDSLASMANFASNKTLEISSLKKALAKVQQNGSEAPAGTADSYRNRLKQLGAAT